MHSLEDKLLSELESLRTHFSTTVDKFAKDLKRQSKIMMRSDKRQQREYDELQDKHKEVSRLNKIINAEKKSLEVKVKERTKELDKAYKELKQKQEQLIQAEKLASLGGLVAGVAHELNTPLGIGLTAASYAKDLSNEIKEKVANNTLKKTELNSFLSDINESTTLVLNNIKRSNELVQCFKLVAADQESHVKGSFNLKDYLGSIVTSLHYELEKSGHVISIQCPEKLVITNYPGAFALVMTNFIMNAIKHAFKDGDKGEMQILVLCEESDITLQFRDNGQGISKKNLSKIFEPFFTTKRNAGGTGLGLHIVHNTVVKTIKGNITCESSRGKGTSFFVNFPKEI